MFLIKNFDASFPTVELWLAQTNLCVCVYGFVSFKDGQSLAHNQFSPGGKAFKQQGGIGSDSAAFFCLSSPGSFSFPDFVLLQLILWCQISTQHLDPSFGFSLLSFRPQFVVRH